MAHIFKLPRGESKGIVVFTHKEFGWFNGFGISKKDIFRPWLIPFNIFGSCCARFKINKLKSKYYIGVHWGFFSKNVVTPKNIDFHMSAPGTCSFVGDPFVIPLSSANFTPSVMSPRQSEKYWDVICVAKNDKKKCYPELMRSIRKIFDLGYNYRILFVIASNKIENSHRYYSSIMDDYYAMFSAEERERLTIVKTHPDIGFQGFSYTFLSHLYNQSKIFTIFSQEEGECRVIKEAQMCGLPVVVKSDMRGGGRDYLDENNSITFDSYETAHKKIIDAVENYKKFNVDYQSLVFELGENQSIEKLKFYLSLLYKDNDDVFDGVLINTDNLNRRLPAHFFCEDIRWASGPQFRFKTTDIVNLAMFNDFYNCLE